MANGMEDLQEKNKESQKAADVTQYDQWRTFQGREDAEMLLEKSAAWSARKNIQRERDSWSEDD